jgi:hypothetical protein
MKLDKVFHGALLQYVVELTGCGENKARQLVGAALRKDHKVSIRHSVRLECEKYLKEKQCN